MMKDLLRVFCLSIMFTVVVSCQKEVDDQGSMGNRSNIEALRAKLEGDSVFKSYEAAFNQQLLFMLIQREVKQKFDKEIFAAGAKSIQSKEDYYALCEKAGLVEPEKQEQIHFRLLKAQEALFVKYPQIRKFSKSDRDILMKFSDHRSGEIVLSFMKFRKGENTSINKQRR